MRIVTRSDFDGIVCAVLLYETNPITEPVLWTEPNDVQKGRVAIHPGDILANLPYAEGAILWFDHHYTNRIEKPFNGAFQIAPSAARVIYTYYGCETFRRDFEELVAQADKIDAADLSRDEVSHPEHFPYILLSMTISGRNKGDDEPYWNRLIDLLRFRTIDAVLADEEVRKRCGQTVERNKMYSEMLIRHTHVEKQVAITDFRECFPTPNGNRFLVYSLFPEAVVHLKISFDDRNRERVILNVGHSIFNRNCRVNAGLLLSEFEGGGHRGAGASQFHVNKLDRYLPRILDILMQNQPNEPQPQVAPSVKPL